MDKPLELRSDQFTFALPVWFIAVSHSGVEHDSVSLTNPDIGIVVCHEAKALVLFTDRSIAERFAESLEVRQPLLTEIKTGHEFLDLLLVNQMQGLTRILLNYRPDQREPRYCSIAEIINVIRSGRSGQ